MATSGSSSDSPNTSSGTHSAVWGSPSGAGPGVTSTAASVAVVPTVEAAVPIAMAAPEEEELGKKEM
jgi:hypothetical protein